MKMIKSIFVLLVVFSAQFSQAQNQDLELAKRYFERTYYSKAIPIYEAAANEDPAFEVVRNLADSYYFTNDYAQAKRWYTLLVRRYEKMLDEEYFFRYLHTVKATGNYDEANVILRDRLTIKGDTASVSALDKEVELLENISGIGNRFEIKNLPINTKNSEFAAVEYEEKLLFSGIRHNGKMYKWNAENYLDILAIPLEKLQLGDSVATSFSEEINTPVHEGNAIFTKDGKTIYFTRNNSKNGKHLRNKDHISHLQLFSGQLIDGKWAKITPLPFNSSDYSTEHPALSNDEMTLYFASDMPGSIGSFDIYSVRINGGAFDTPKNLGALVNTEKKEQFPFISKDDKLYFSSNGHFGYGALDVFVSEFKNDTFTTPLNVGLPVNSGYDDFSFNIDPDTKLGYFASNRQDGKGGDDIYGVKETKPLIIEGCKQFIEGTITDIDTKLPLEKAVVILEDSDRKQLESTITGVDGTFRFSVKCEKVYYVTSSKELYSSAERTLTLKKERNKVNDASMELKSETKLKKDLEAQKQREKETGETEKKRRIADMLSKEKDVVRDRGRLVIKTEPIYFDYDLWYIRKESKPILQRVIDLMNKYPQMVVEIGSHTDVRGNNAYNLELSAKRAASTRDYFLEKGIPEKRIFSKGYGETVPIIKCIPDHSCNEEQHELNRRSEFVIQDL